MCTRNNAPDTQGSRLTNPAVLLATWFGAGLLPKAPGTWGSLMALPFAWLLHQTTGWIGLGIGVVIVSVVGIWAANGYTDQLGGEDPGPVVIDEVAGQWLTLLPVAYYSPDTPDVVSYGLAFLLFRLADIFKPWPASWADRTIKGGLGIMVDDLLAAIYAGFATMYIILLA